MVSVRRQRGQDILAACGQLAIKRSATRAASSAPPPA
jgi:adenine C2-methylase RlmN of 23S rRNA A2503 and tRNA A37